MSPLPEPLYLFILYMVACHGYGLVHQNECEKHAMMQNYSTNVFVWFVTFIYEYNTSLSIDNGRKIFSFILSYKILHIIKWVWKWYNKFKNHTCKNAKYLAWFSHLDYQIDSRYSNKIDIEQKIMYQNANKI